MKNKYNQNLHPSTDSPVPAQSGYCTKLPTPISRFFRWSDSAMSLGLRRTARLNLFEFPNRVMFGSLYCSLSKTSRKRTSKASKRAFSRQPSRAKDQQNLVRDVTETNLQVHVEPCTLFNKNTRKNTLRILYISYLESYLFAPYIINNTRCIHPHTIPDPPYKLFWHQLTRLSLQRLQGTALSCA